MTESEFTMDTPMSQKIPEVEFKQENMFTGIVGAVLGAVIGGAAIVLLGQIGIVAAIAGLILAVCTLKGYELLGKGRGTVGTILCVLLMLLTPYIADRISWALIIVRDLEVDFATAFASVHEVVELAELTGDYIKDLVLVYVFTALGAFGTLKSAFKKK